MFNWENFLVIYGKDFGCGKEFIHFFYYVLKMLDQRYGELTFPDFQA